MGNKWSNILPKSLQARKKPQHHTMYTHTLSNEKFVYVCIHNTDICTHNDALSYCTLKNCKSKETNKIMNNFTTQSLHHTLRVNRPRLVFKHGYNDQCCKAYCQGLVHLGQIIGIQVMPRWIFSSSSPSLVHQTHMFMHNDQHWPKA